MNKLIEKYKKNRKQRIILLMDIISGIVLLIYTIIYGYTSLANNTTYYLVIFVIIFMINFALKYLYKMYLIYGLKENLSWNKLAIHVVNNQYKKKIDSINKENIKKILDDISSKQVEVYYNYLCNTKSNVEFLRKRDILLMAFSFVFGAGFDNNARISIELLSNALTSTIACFLAIAPFYIIFITLYVSYGKLTNDNILKSEMLNYIDEIKYDEIKSI